MTDEKILEELKSFSYTFGLDPDQLAVFSSYVELLEFEPDTTVFKEGDDGDSVYFILKGELEVSMDSDWGEAIKIASLNDGSVFCEMSLIDELPRSASITSRSKSSVMKLNKNNFETILEKHPAIGVSLLKGLAQIVCQRVRESNSSLSEYLEPI